MFPNVQSKPALVHLMLISLILPLVSHEKTPTHTWPPPFSPGIKITLKVTFSKTKVSFNREAQSRTNPLLSPHPSVCQNVFFYGFLLFLYLHSTILSALDAFITTVMNPAFKITVSLISRLSSEPENQDSKCNGNFGISPLLIGFFSPSPPGCEGANKFIRISPIRIFFQLDVCQLCSSQVEQISNVLSLFSLLFCYRMHFKTINPIIPGRFMIEREILIFPLGYKCLLPFFLHSSSCSNLDRAIYHPPSPKPSLH